MEDNYSKLYKAMVNSGYDTADLGGSEDDFRREMQDSTTRKNFYDWVSNNEMNGFRIGSYDAYEERLAPNEAPQVEAAQGDNQAGVQSSIVEDRKPQSYQLGKPNEMIEAMKGHPQMPVGSATLPTENRNQDIFAGRDNMARYADYSQNLRKAKAVYNMNPTAENAEQLDSAAMNFSVVETSRLDAEKEKRAREELLAERKRLADAKKEAELRLRTRRGEIASPSGMYQMGMAPVTGNQAAEITDSEMTKLYAAVNSYDNAIRSVDRKLSGEEPGFWEGVADATVRNPGFYTMGLTDMSDARGMLDIAQNGVKGKEDELLADALYSKNAEQQDEDFGFLYRAGNMFGHSVPFMVQTAATGSFSGASRVGANLAGRLGKKAAEGTIKKKIINAMGTTIDDVIEAGLIANTAGAGGTWANIAERKAGKINIKDGNYVFENGESWLGALYKGEVSSILELYTEKLGGHLEGKLSLTKGLDKIGASRVSNVLLAAKNSDLYKGASTVMRQFGLNGYLPEVLEEEANLVLNSLLVGDNSLSELYNLKTQLDIFGGMLLTVGTMQAIPGTIATAGYVKNQYQMNRADSRAADVFGEDWGAIKEALDNATNEKVAGVVSENLRDNVNQNEALLDYYKRMMIMRGYNIGTVKNETAPEIEEAYSDGFSQEPTGVNAVKEANEYTNARNEVVKVLSLAEGADVDAMLEGRTAEEIAMGDSEIEDAVNNYIKARARRDGFRERYQEERDRQFAESDRSVDETANDGIVYTTTTPSGEKIIITGGKVVLDNEGYIDVNQSEGLVAMFPDSSRKSVRPGDLREKVEVSNAEETKAARRASIEEQWRAEFESAENAYVEQQKRTEGVVFDVTDKDGTHRVEVVKEGDEMSSILVDGKAVQISTEMLNALRGEAGVTQAENANAEGENEVQPVVAPVVEDQNGDNTEKVVESSPTGEAAAPVVEAPKTALEQIPRNEKNIPLYEQVDSELAWDGVVEEAGGNEETAMVAVSSMVEDKKKALAAAEKAKARAGVTIAEKIAAENERVANIEKAKADLAKWEEIAGVKAKRALAAENVAQPVAETAPVVESAPVAEVETPQATNEMQEADLENAEKDQKAVEPVEKTDSSTLSQTSDQVSEQEKQSTQSVGEQVQAAEAEVNTTPTDAQKEAGNYKKGHVKIGPFNISIEQPKGSVRSGVDKDGKKWEVEMQNTYGYFRGTEGVDGDHIDVFLSNDIDGWEGRLVFVVDQRNADGSFDEHKVMLGFNDINDAEAAYMSNYEEGWQGLGTITGVSIEEFEKWLSSSHRKTKAFAEYKNIKTDEGQSTSSESGVLLSDEVADAGPVNRETLQLNMSEEDFNALLNSGDKAAISEYLAEMDGLLRIGAGSPLDGRDAIVKEYRGVVEQYGGEENIPADVVAGFDERIAPYNALQRAVFDRKYALQDKLREIETNEAQAKERAEKEAKAEHKKTAFGGFLSGKTDLGASAAEKALSKKYNFDGKVMTVAEFVEDAVGNGNVKLSAIEEPKYKGASRAAWNRMDARQQEADAKRVKESGTKTVYTVNDHDLGKTAYDYAKFLLDKKAEQEKATAKQKVKDAIEPFAKEKAAEQAPIKIEDVGEKIGGARKDVIRKYADKIKLDGKTFGTMFPKPEIDQLVEAGLPLDRVAAVKAMFDNAKREYERTKKRMGKDKALSASLFYAMYAKNVLNGETDNFDLKYNGWVFTDWGKEYMKANIALYRAVFEKLGVEYGKMDLAKYAITPLDAQYKKMFNLKALNESNARMQALRAKEKGEEPPVYKDGDLINFVGENHARPSDQFETLEEAVNAMVERIGKEVKPGAEALYKPEVYWKTDERGRADYSKTFVGVKVRGFGTVDLMEFKSSNEARQWLDEHGDDFQQMAAAKEIQVKAENKKPLPKYSIEYTLDRVNSQYAVVANFGRGKVHTLRTFDFPEDDARARMSVFKDEVMPFLNSQEAVQAANEYAEELQQKKSAPKNVVVEKNSRERVGVDWRNGQDATTEMFVDVEGKEPSVFGFRALEFGNYVSQKERQQYLNDIYDALMDMSEVLGVSPRALSLGGKLALAVGARGTSGASGHYEPYKNVINITKTKGAGVLAHEWLHALDRYFSNFDENALYPNGVRYATGKEYAENTRQEIKDAFEKIMSAVRGGEYQNRSARLGDYWASDKELAARALQDYMMRKLDERGQKNDFLSNHLAPEDWAGDMNNYPFPLGAEVDRIAEAFDNFFATVEEKTEDGQTVLFQQGMIELDRENPAFERATENVRKKLEATGVKVKVLTKEEAESELARLEELADMQKRKSPETALPEDESSFKGTVISSDNGTKVLKDLDSAIERYENKGNSTKTFIGDVGKILHAVRYGSKSEYADFVTANGIPVRIRLADHNAKISNFDHYDVDNGISIVISRAENTGVVNDGDAHLVEFFYSDKKLKAADGKPLVEILKSIKQALYSGEYKDNTGLAQAEEVNIPEFLRTSDGITYGWAVNGEIYLTPEGLNPNTPIHEYTHLWAAALQKSNPKLWSEVVEAMKLSPAWNEVMADENYTDIYGDENRVTSEVLSRLSGNEGYRRYMEQAEAEIAAERNIGEKVRKKGILNRIKNAVSRFWNWLKGKLGSKAKAGDGTEAKTEPWDVFVNKSLKDFDEGVNPDAKDSPLDRMFIGKKELTPEQKKKQEALKENAKAIRRLHNVKANYPITALRNLGFALETQEQREMHDRLFAERDAMSGRENAVSVEVNPQGMTLQERITESLLKMAEQNKDNVELRLSAIRAYGRDLANVIKLMRAQRGYDRNTVNMFVSLAKMYLRNNAMSGMLSYDISRLLGLISRANGGYGPQVMRAAEQIAEIITKSHTRELEDVVRKQIKTGAEKVNASGVVVQGGVDVVGKRVLNTFRDAINMTSEEEFEKAFREAFERAAKFPNDEEAKAACDAMVIAKEYRDNIIEAKKQESELLKSINQYSDIRSRYDRGEITRREYNEFVDAVRKSIIELRSRMVDDYQRIIHALGGDISEGMKRAKEFRERELARVEKIHNMAEADMSGVSKSAERKKRGFWRKATDYVAFKNPLAKVVAEGLGTYNEFMKFFGRNAIGGKGRLYDYFIGRYTEVQNQEWVEKQKDIKKIDERCEMVFGKGFKDVMRDSEKNSGVVLEYWNGGERVSRDLSIGQLMYIYMTAKQTDGEMKLRGMGITEETVNKAVAVLPARYKVFADWVQSDFLPEMRPRLNEVHKRMFGASMSEVKNYFPLVVNTDARQAEVDLNSVMPITPSTITGSIIKRKVNATPLNLESNAFDVLLNHVSDMEHWAAFAEFTRDNNTLIGDKDFMNRVKNSRDLRFGDGEAIWDNFVETARITTGNYRAKKDEWANVMKGVSSAKITFGYYTALKQFLSAPAMWLETGAASIIKATVNPLGSWRWAIENLPGFEERWKGRTAGNERLADSDSDWSIWDNRVVKAAREVGMKPNAFVDAVVVSTGARAVYDSRKRFYKALGLSRDEQHKRALKDAAVAYNETQQSAQGAYLSILQKEGGFKAMVMTLYRNSQMAYSRKVTGSMAELYKKAVRWKDILDNEEKKYLEMGLSEEDAKKEANKALLKSAGKDVATLVMFGYVLNMVWYLGEQLPYLLFGDDEEEKEKIMDTSLKIGATGMFEGFALGNVAKDLYVKGVTGNRYSSDMLTTPFASDAEKIINRFANDGTFAGMSQLLILGAETATGISPQRLIDDVAAVIDFCNGDLDKATEVTLLTTRLAKVPQSQIDKLYLEEALGGDVVALAERYAEYKRLRDYPLNIGDDKIFKKYAERFKKAHNEDLKEIVRDENAYEGYFSYASPEEKIKLAGYRGEYLEELTGKKAEEVLTGRELIYYTLYGRKEQNLVYSAMTTPDDVDDEICIEMMMSELQPIQDEYMKVEDWKAYKKLHEKELGMYDELKRKESDISYEKSKMKENPVYAEEGMTKIRTLRAEAVELINKYRNE